MIYQMCGGPWDGWNFDLLLAEDDDGTRMSELFDDYTFARDGIGTWNGDDGE